MMIVPRRSALFFGPPCLVMWESRTGYRIDNGRYVGFLPIGSLMLPVNTGSDSAEFQQADRRVRGPRGTASSSRNVRVPSGGSVGELRPAGGTAMLGARLLQRLRYSERGWQLGGWPVIHA